MKPSDLGYYEPGLPMELASAVFRSMLEMHQRLGKVVVGTDEARNPGDILIDVPEGRAVIMERSNRAEFVKYAPTPPSGSARFYWEIGFLITLDFMQERKGPKH